MKVTTTWDRFLQRAVWTAMIRACIVGLALCSPRSTGPVAADWPHLRGPNYDGVCTDTGLVDSLPARGLPILWNIPLGQGYSGLIAVGDRVYTQTQTRAGQFVVCLEADTGRTRWRRRTGWPWDPDGEWPGPRATPTFHDGRIYFADAYGLVGCLRAEDGRMVWSVNVTERYKGRGTEFGYSCTPLVMDGKVIVPVGGEGAGVVALGAQDGKEVWRAGEQWASYSSAIPARVDGKQQVVTFLRNSIAGFDAQTGRPLWEENWSEGYDEHSAWPLYAEPYLLTSSAFRLGSKLLRLGGGEGNGPAELVWKNTELSNDVCSSIIVGEHVYGFDLKDMQPGGPDRPAGRFKCIELKSGQVAWSTDRTGHTTVIAADGKLIMVNEAGELIVARCTSERYEELFRTPVLAGGRCWTQPTINNGRLYVRNQTEAVCVYLGREGLEGVTTTADTGRHEVGGEVAASGIWKGSSLTTPGLGDVLVWFGFCVVGVFGLSWLVGLAVGGVAGWLRSDWKRAGGEIGLTCSALGLGVAGTVVFSGIAGRFVFTWPAALFVVFFIAVSVATISRRDTSQGRWGSLGAGLGFVLTCVVYYYLCRGLFIAMGPGFLVGFLPAAGLVVPAARRLAQGSSLAETALWGLGAFSVYFWVSALFTVWRT